jgi:hypothetical protein
MQAITVTLSNTQELRILNKLTVSGGLSLVLAPNESFGSPSSVPGVHKFFKNQSFTYPLPGVLAPGVSVTFTPGVEYYFVQGGPQTFTALESVSMAMRFWGGAV